MKRYEELKVRDKLYQILETRNLAQNETDALVDALISADKHGVHTHGLSVFTSHVERIDRGGYSIGIKPRIEKDYLAFMTVDAQNTIGFCSAKFCMEKAIERANDAGVYIVFCRNCNTYGAAFYYTKMATERNMIGITFSNSPSAMAPWGGYEKMLGTNPFAIGIPGDKEGPILFDMATSIVAKSKINEASKRGESIPEGWAIDVEGNPTTDPIEAIKGIVLPMAGPKGYGLALSIDIIAGLLSGAAYLNNVGRFYSEDNSSMNVGQVFTAINPKRILSDSFYSQVDEYIKEIKESKAIGAGQVLFPGERKLKEFNISSDNGIEISDNSIESINGLLHRANNNTGL